MPKVSKKKEKLHKKKAKVEKKEKKEKKSKAETAPRVRELELYDQGYDFVCGVDECGRGSGAAEMTVTAAIIKPNVPTIDGVRDSKKFSKQTGKSSATRERMAADLLKQDGPIHHTHWVSVEKIDSLGVHYANLQGMDLAVDECVKKALEKYRVEGRAPKVFVFVDGTNMPFGIPKKYDAECVKQGDSKIYAIAFASIICKVTRDRHMIELAKKYPIYDWHENYGYLSQNHIAKIKEYGISDHHRRSFNPVRTMLLEQAKLTKEDDDEEKAILKLLQPKVSSAAN